MNNNGIKSIDKIKPTPKWISIALDTMGVVYIAFAFLLLVSPDSIILWGNTVFLRFGWPLVFFPTEKFWSALAWSVPGTRACLAFGAARRPGDARLFLWPLQVSLCLAGAMFAFQFVVHQHAPLYALASIVELTQALFYYFLARRLS